MYDALIETELGQLDDSGHRVNQVTTLTDQLEYFNLLAHARTIFLAN